MNVFLKETEEVEKCYVRCRAKTLGESRRLEEVEPEVLNMLGGGGGAGMMSMMGMMGGGMMMGMNGGGGGGGMGDGGSAGNNAVTPRDSL